MGRRRDSRRQERTTVLIVTNGTRTEMAYLKEIKRLARFRPISITIQPVPGDPQTVLRKLKTPAVDASAYDEVWVVVDEDGVDRSEFARQVAKTGPKVKGVALWRAVVSRPCFEVWLVAHYEQVHRYQGQDEAQRHFDKVASERQTPKHLPNDFPFELDELARERCQLAGVESREGDLLPPSPGSHVGVLVARLLRDI